MIKCPRCGSENQNGTKYCYNCSYELNETAKEITCSLCGHKNPPDAEKCECGAYLRTSTDSKEEPVVQSPPVHPKAIAVKAIANTIMTIGIIASIVMAFTILFVEGDYSFERVFSWMGFGIICGELFSTYVIYLALTAISETLRITSLNNSMITELWNERRKDIKAE